ncbi:dTMP kinase [Micromonospora sp. ZYX-F-536]|uniref:dTMP kinase n=1 Tax=Micromonospora sp. ZYX-F-536 TaxID=3457629 RepID=UPI0040408CAB
MTRHPRGPALVVAVEGLEGAGKTTVVQRCAAMLSARSVSATVVPEFTSSPLGSYLMTRLSTDRFLRDPANVPSAWTQVFSVVADLAYAVEYAVPAAARTHTVVLKDRWHESVVACQHVALADEYGLDDRVACGMIDGVVRTLPDPADVRIWLHAPEAVRVDRLRARADYDPEDLPVLRRRERAYQQLLSDPRRRGGFVFVDSSRPVGEVVDAVLETIMTALDGPSR